MYNQKIPGSHLCFPNFDPTKLATVSPIPTDKIPAISGNRSRPAESVMSHGHGCNHIGKAKPATKYIGVKETTPASFSSTKTEIVC